MKRYYLTILVGVLLILYACNHGYESPKEIDPKELNEKIMIGVQANAQWVKTPKSIVAQLLPKNARQEGNPSYNFEEIRLSVNSRRIIVIEEGSFDDEVSGEKHILDFIFVENRWAISKMYYSLKRRY